MNLRSAIKEDAKKIAEISRVAFVEAFRNDENAEEVDTYIKGLDEKYFLSNMVSDSYRFLVVTDDRGVFGFAQMIRKTPPSQEGDVWLKLERLYLDPKRIGTGAGKLLMKGYLDMCLEESISNAWLEVLNTNTRAVRFYEHLGFKTFDTCPGKFKDPLAFDLRMKKSIA